MTKICFVRNESWTLLTHRLGNESLHAERKKSHSICTHIMNLDSEKENKQDGH